MVVGSCLMTFFLWLVLCHFTTKNYLEEFRAEVIYRISEWIDKELTFSKDNHIPKSTFIESGMFHRKPRRLYKGRNLVSLSLDGTRFKFSELDVRYHSYGSLHTLPLFDGVFGVCELDCVFPDRTVIVPSKVTTTYLKSVGKALERLSGAKDHLIDIGHPEFEHFFAVYGNNTRYTKTILSENLINIMLDFRKTTMDPVFLVYISFIGSRIFFAIWLNRDFLKLSGSIIDFRQIEVYFEIMRLAVSIVEEIKSNPRIEGA
jgi:hypothetical protein